MISARRYEGSRASYNRLNSPGQPPVAAPGLLFARTAPLQHNFQRHLEEHRPQSGPPRTLHHCWLAQTCRHPAQTPCTFGLKPATFLSTLCSISRNSASPRSHKDLAYRRAFLPLNLLVEVHELPSHQLRQCSSNRGFAAPHEPARATIVGVFAVSGRSVCGVFSHSRRQLATNNAFGAF